MRPDKRLFLSFSLCLLLLSCYSNKHGFVLSFYETVPCVDPNFKFPEQGKEKAEDGWVFEISSGPDFECKNSILYSLNKGETFLFPPKESIPVGIKVGKTNNKCGIYVGTYYSDVLICKPGTDFYDIEKCKKLQKEAVRRSDMFIELLLEDSDIKFTPPKNREFIAGFKNYREWCEKL